MKEYFSVISSARLFAGVEAEALPALLDCLAARAASFAKGAYILREGQQVESLGLLAAGSALIFQEDCWGNRNLLAPVEPGQCFGETFACAPGAAATVNVVAQKDSKVLFFNVGRLLAAPAPGPWQGLVLGNLLADLAQKNLRLNRKVTHLGQRSTRAKVLSYLSAEARRQGRGEFDIPFSRQQLADYLSVERSGLSLELGRLRDEGLLEFHRNHFVLKT